MCIYPRSVRPHVVEEELQERLNTDILFQIHVNNFHHTKPKMSKIAYAIKCASRDDTELQLVMMRDLNPNPSNTHITRKSILIPTRATTKIPEENIKCLFHEQNKCVCKSTYIIIKNVPNILREIPDSRNKTHSIKEWILIQKLQHNNDKNSPYMMGSHREETP